MNGGGGEDDDDGALVGRCLEAKEAFAELYHRHAPALFSYLRGLLGGDEHLAADLLQDTFVRAWAALPRFDRRRALRPWLFAIATHAALDVIVRRNRVQVRPPDELREPVGREPDPAGTASVQDAFAALVRRSQGRIAPRKVATFLLVRGHGMTYDEAAAVQDCSPATVKRDLSEAAEVLAQAAAELGLA